MSSDDDLPPPPPKAAAPKPALTDSDDDLGPPPPPKPAAKKAPADSDDDLAPPPTKKAADSDDDMPPPPAKKAAADSDDDLPPPPAGKSPATAGSPAAADGAAATRPRATFINVAQDGDAAAPAAVAAPGGGSRKRTATVSRRSIQDVTKEGFLFKQSPSWPYSSQKRWCVLKGRVLTYFEQQNGTTPCGSLDLKGAVVLTEKDGIKEKHSAKMPNSFGLTGPTGQLKSRVYIFSTMTRDELQSWIDTIQLVAAEPKASELHWFEKMAQGIF